MQSKIISWPDNTGQTGSASQPSFFNEMKKDQGGQGGNGDDSVTLLANASKD
jgi:hypothetical protein